MNGILTFLGSAILSAAPDGAAAVDYQPVHWEYWVAFGAAVVFLLALDLFVFHRESHAPTLRESAGWSAFWIALAMVFNGVIWWTMGNKPAVEYFTGYVIEKSLSMDNVFVFAVIFRFFRVPLKYQYHVLFWGILGAIVMRLIFILAGAALIHRFDWVLVIFGAILIYTAIKLAIHKEADVHPENNIVLRAARRLLKHRISREGHEVHGDRFFIREAGRLVITPLFLVLLVVESTDVVFAIDSVPAIFGITKNPFIVFTSNIFAILGLRALYFLLAGFIDLFRYLGYGLAAVLGFVGVKMIAEYVMTFYNPDFHISPAISLVVVIGLLAISIVASIIAKSRENGLEIREPAETLEPNGKSEELRSEELK